MTCVWTMAYVVYWEGSYTRYIVSKRRSSRGRKKTMKHNEKIKKKEYKRSVKQTCKLNENIWCNTCSFMQHDWPLKRLTPKALSIKGTGKPWSGISSSSCAKLWSFILFYSRLYTFTAHTRPFTHTVPHLNDITIAMQLYRSETGCQVSWDNTDIIDR